MKQYKVKKILDSKVRKGKKFYLVHWKGYDASDSTWEPEENLENFKDEMKALDRAQKYTKTHKITKVFFHSASSR